MPIVLHHLRNRQALLAAAAIAYLAAERDLFEQHGQTAVRFLDDNDRRRLARLAHDLGWRRVKRHAHLVTVATLRRWWRDLVQPQPTQVRRGGRQPISADTMQLILTFARENSLGNDAWGRRRICGELREVGTVISDSTVRRTLQRHGFPPAPARGRAWDGPVVVAASDPGTVAIDFTQVTVGLGSNSRSLYILAAIHLGSRQVEILGITEHPDSAWVAQVARNLTMDSTRFLHRMGATAVLMDRDKLFTDQFRNTLFQAGFDVHRTPPQCPWCNGYIERFWSALKNGIVRKAIWLDEEALRQAVVEFSHDHYLHERPHQGLDNRPPKSLTDTAPDTSRPVVRHDRLAGLIHVYRRAA